MYHLRAPATHGGDMAVVSPVASTLPPLRSALMVHHLVQKEKDGLERHQSSSRSARFATRSISNNYLGKEFERGHCQAQVVPVTAAMLSAGAAESRRESKMRFASITSRSLLSSSSSMSSIQSTTDGLQSDGDDDKSDRRVHDQSKLSRRKAQSRRNQAKYRRKRKTYEMGLPEQVEQLRQGVQRLEALHQRHIQDHEAKAWKNAAAPTAAAAVRHDLKTISKFIHMLILPCVVPERKVDLPSSVFEAHVAPSVTMHQHSGLDAFVLAWWQLENKFRHLAVNRKTVRYSQTVIGEIVIVRVRMDVGIPFRVLTDRAVPEDPNSATSFSNGVNTAAQLTFQFNAANQLIDVAIHLDLWESLNHCRWRLRDMALVIAHFHFVQ